MATLGRVLERDPDFSRLPTATPAAIHRLLRRALDKNPRRRLASMSDALLDLEDGQASLERGRADDAYRGRRGLPLRWLAVAAVSVLALAVLWSFTEPGEPVPAVVELGVPIPPDQEVVVGQLSALAVSRDGRMLVYRARQEGVMKLFARGSAAARSCPFSVRRRRGPCAFARRSLRSLCRSRRRLSRRDRRHGGGSARPAARRRRPVLGHGAMIRAFIERLTIVALHIRIGILHQCCNAQCPKSRMPQWGNPQSPDECPDRNLQSAMDARARSCCRRARKSPGSGASTAIRRRVSGWGNASRQACRSGRSVRFALSRAGP